MSQEGEYPRSMRIVSLPLLTVLITAIPADAATEQTTVMLHAQATLSGCGPQFDCVGTSPIVTVAPGSEVFVFVYLRNYDNVDGFVCRFGVAGGKGPNTWGDWTIRGAVFSCIPGQLGHVPWQGGPPGVEPGN